MNLKKFEYDGKEITFQLGNGDVMINATEMAKPFGKRPAEWLRLPSTASFLEALSSMGKSHSDDYQSVTTVNGGTNPGTWMHEDVAIEFARWLHPAFAIWCNDRIKELLKYGGTAMNPEDLLNPDFIIGLATQLKREREEKARIIEEKQNMEIYLEEVEPKIRHSEEILRSDGLYPIRVTAMDFGLTSNFFVVNFMFCSSFVYYRVIC